MKGGKVGKEKMRLQTVNWQAKMLQDQTRGKRQTMTKEMRNLK
jgi:hypothetical protein